MKGDKRLNYRIVEEEAFTVIGKILQVTSQNNEHLRQISNFWDECHKDGTIEKLGFISKDNQLLGIMINMHTYMIACKADTASYDEGFTFETIPASNWATFTSIGPLPGAIQRTFAQIFQDWLPSSEYDHAGAPVLEVYPSGDTTAEDYRCEIWIPVTKK